MTKERWALSRKRERSAEEDTASPRAYSRRMKINWIRAVGGALIAEIAQVAATFAWVAIYSFVINPGQPAVQYELHAAEAGPWVSILAGIPIFYAASRWIARSQATALALFAVFVVIDGALMVSMAESWTGFMFAVVGLSYATKLGACVLGGRHTAAAT